jgi:hypothetical protein
MSGSQKCNTHIPQSYMCQDHLRKRPLSVVVADGMVGVVCSAREVAEGSLFIPVKNCRILDTYVICMGRFMYYCLFIIESINW